MLDDGPDSLDNLVADLIAEVGEQAMQRLDSHVVPTVHSEAALEQLQAHYRTRYQALRPVPIRRRVREVPPECR